MDECEKCGKSLGGFFSGRSLYKHYVVCKDCYQELMEAEESGTCETCANYYSSIGADCPKPNGGRCSHFKSSLEEYIRSY